MASRGPGARSETCEFMMNEADWFLVKGNDIMQSKQEKASNCLNRNFCARYSVRSIEDFKTVC